VSATDDGVLVADALRRLYADAGLPAPAPAGGTAAPVRLDRLIQTYNLVHAEVPGLCGAAAFAHLAREGILRPELRDDTGPLAGFLFANAHGGYILVRGDDPLPRRRFTAAHELGHYLLHFLPRLGREASEEPMIQADGAETVCEEEKAPEAEGPTLPEMERQANRFAAELLMPEPVCRTLYAAHSEHGRATPRFLAHQLAADLLVSREAARWRLRALRLAQ
jgi:Zn-dependent peptidase ImmA (M78 family)